MKKEIIINSSSTETRIGILENDQLIELFVERPENERMVGDIFKGRVENVVEAVQAAFVDIGMELNGFLPFAEVEANRHEFSALAETVEDDDEKTKRQKHRRPKSSSHSRRRRPPVKKNEEILVQITKEPIGTKGARLTTDISLPGRFLVLVPHNNSVGVSKKISDFKERRRLRMLAKSLRPEGFGLIIRTVAVGKDVQTIKADMDNLVRTWQRLEERLKVEKSPKLVHKDMGITSSVIRDLFSPDIDALVVDSRKLYGDIKKYLKEVAPGLLPKLSYYKQKAPIFDAYKIEDEIAKSLQRKIWMKSGGHLIFDQTEALVVVDVNSGRSISQRDHEKNALQTDLEAAREIGRQLRLRDIGGIIVIDFIDLQNEQNRRKVVSTIRKELDQDRAAFDLLPMNDFGLVSLTRERVRPSLLYRYSDICPRCAGLGRIPAKSTIITQIERRIQNRKSKTRHRRFILMVHPDVEHYLASGLKSRIRSLMLKYLVTIKVRTDENLRDEDFLLMTHKEERERAAKAASDN